MGLRTLWNDGRRNTNNFESKNRQIYHRFTAQYIAKYHTVCKTKLGKECVC